IPPAIFFYYSTLFDSRFKTLQQNRKGNAIYMGTAGYGNYSNSRHALALFGWVNQGGYQTYYVWNPWYNYPTVISANAGPVTIPVPGGGFSWDNTITNW
ncbi:hypothetical protein AB0X59_12670, partial [Enterococcus cecorum]